MWKRIQILPLVLLMLNLVACAQSKNKGNASANKSNIPEKSTIAKEKNTLMDNKNIQVITLGAGCFWCVEAVFQSLTGVQKVVSGYSGGHIVNPTYEQVCDKTTGHAEVCQLYYDTTKITLPEILEVYWQTHDPTTPNQQGADKGPQYRSVIFYHNDEQKKTAEEYKNALDKSGAFNAPIVTGVEAFTNFYAAEDYHQNYYKNNPNQGYCYYVIKPKLEKFAKVFATKVKKD